MLYLYLDNNEIKVFGLKKSFLGQYEVGFFQKTYQTNLLENTTSVNVDILASAIREAIAQISPGVTKEKEVILILKQEFFQFFRTNLPLDITDNAVTQFILQKAQTILSEPVTNFSSNYFITKNESQKTALFYAIKKNVVGQLSQALKLIGLQYHTVMPDSVTQWQLFEKTLRKDKQELILYLSYTKDELSGYLYDSSGLLKTDYWNIKGNTEKNIETILKEKAVEMTKSGQKINRLILSGAQSTTIRQDIFTKNVGIWTNPLLKIAQNFYQEYLKLFNLNPQQLDSILIYDVCWGAFVCQQQHAGFIFSDKNLAKQPTISNVNINDQKRFSIPKEILIFIGSFIFSFLLFLFLSKKLPAFNAVFPNINQTKAIPTTNQKQTQLPTVTPTPTINREMLKIKIRNGSGMAGKAAELKTYLLKKGYQEILIDNADRFDYKITEVYSEATKSAIFQSIKSDLTNVLPNLKNLPIEKGEKFDAIIIIGQDY